MCLCGGGWVPGSDLCIWQCIGQSHARKNSPTSHAASENPKQVAVFSTILGGTIHLHDEVNSYTVGDLHSHYRSPRLGMSLEGKSVYNELNLNQDISTGYFCVVEYTLSILGMQLL